MRSKSVENFDKNVELLNYFASTRHFKDVLFPVYGEIDENVVDVVFYSILNNGVFGNFYNVTKAKFFSDLINEFSKTKIIPIYQNRLADEYIGYSILDKKFVKVTFEQPKQKEFSTEILFEKQAYLTHEQSSKFEYYCNLPFVKQEYEALIEKVKNFIKSDKLFVKLLKNAEYKENSRKRKFLSKFFALRKEISLLNRVLNFLEKTRVDEPYNEEAEKMVSFIVLDYLSALLRID